VLVLRVAGTAAGERPSVESFLIQFTPNHDVNDAKLFMEDLRVLHEDASLPSFHANVTNHHVFPSNAASTVRILTGVFSSEAIRFIAAYDQVIAWLCLPNNSQLCEFVVACVTVSDRGN
jgi:hypothetical protein